MLLRQYNCILPAVHSHFTTEKSTVDSPAFCESAVFSASPSRRVLLRACSLFSCSPAVDPCWLYRDHMASSLRLAPRGLCLCSKGLVHLPLLPLARCVSKKGWANVWTPQAYSQAQNFKKYPDSFLPFFPVNKVTDDQQRLLYSFQQIKQSLLNKIFFYPDFLYCIRK